MLLLHVFLCNALLASYDTSFRSGCRMKVIANGQSSKAHVINADVPQGSQLSDTLFLLYINDLHSKIIFFTIIFTRYMIREPLKEESLCG